MTYVISDERACVDGCCVIAYDTELRPPNAQQIYYDTPGISMSEALERRGTVGTARQMFNVFTDSESGERFEATGRDFEAHAEHLQANFPNDYPPIYL